MSVWNEFPALTVFETLEVYSLLTQLLTQEHLIALIILLWKGSESVGTVMLHCPISMQYCSLNIISLFCQS
jgi:hypothetical protein